MSLRAELIDSPEQLTAVEADWDALAVAAARPYCAPAWLLAWWRSAAPQALGLRVGVVREGGLLVAVAPFFAQRRGGAVSYRTLSAGTSFRVEPLALAGREAEAAAALAPVLAAGDPAPAELSFEGVPSESSWPLLLANAWPGGPASVETLETMPAPTVSLGQGDLDAWLAGRGKEFRRQVRKRGRRLEEAGAVTRLATAETLAADLAALARLHYSRWSERGGSGALDRQIEAMLADAARELLPSGRLRLFTVEIEGRPVASQLALVAGGETAAWLGGFDEEYRSLAPSIHVQVAALADALGRGDRRFDLGGGGQSYKYDFADSEDELAWISVIAPGRRGAPVRARLAAKRLKRAVGRRLPAGVRRRLGR